MHEMTPDVLLMRLIAGMPIQGRHVLVVAHPDDEVISASAALCCFDDAVIVQLTEDTTARDAERAVAQVAGKWKIPVAYGRTRFRQAHLSADRLRAEVLDIAGGADAIWTHPYEGGHLDHDTAAWIVQSVCVVSTHSQRMEFASYHATSAKAQVFGDFWPVDGMRAAVTLSGDRLARKRAALAAYGSQAHILRKFQSPEREVYRAAPRYDFTKPPPPPCSRWDVKGYQPTTAEWRAVIAASTSEAAA